MSWYKISKNDIKKTVKKVAKEIGRAATDVHDVVEDGLNETDDFLDDIAESVRKGLDEVNTGLEKTTGIDFKPIVKTISGPAHILVKIAEGHNLSEATTDWVVAQIDTTSELTGWLGSDVEEVMTTIVSYANLPVLLVAGLLDDSVDIVEGEEAVEDIIGFPLKALLLKAHAIYDPVAKPLPLEVKMLLSNVVSKAVLKRARYVVDLHPNNVAGLANKLNHKGSKRHAVTVDDIIIFSGKPTSDLAGYLHWVHELKHVEQYGERGLLEFAADYTKHYGEVEAEAMAAELLAKPILERLINDLA
ncbi:hypothetical protein [Hyphomonas sp.]|jgi:predicted DNA-binding protein|uniref:hypothetical protein n=1 Tax=Hyphomonas sp. TaxID=87 RepID=UPI0032D91647